MSDIKQRLLSSDEYAGDDAVPEVAHDAHAEIERLEEALKLASAAAGEAEQLHEKLMNALGAEERANERCCDVEDERDRLKAELAALKQQEPVAWRLMDDFCSGEFEYNTRDEFSYGRTGGQPLYLAPQPSQPGEDAKADALLKALEFARRFIPASAVDAARWRAGKSPWHATEIIDTAIAKAKGGA